MNNIILIIYTTLYKKGGEQFKMVAETMASEKKEQNYKVICNPIESKIDVVAQLNTIKYY